MGAGFISTVTRVGVKGGKKTIWTTLPISITSRFGLKEMFTQNGWKQLCRGNVQVDITGYKVGDKVKMLVQSVGLGGRTPIVRGVPDPDLEEQRHTLSEFEESSSLGIPRQRASLDSEKAQGRTPPSLRNK